MNKKFLVCVAIATAILVTACVKKEEPKNESPEQSTAAPEPKPAQFENLESSEAPHTEQTAQNTEKTTQTAAPRVEVERTETAHTTTEIRRTTGAVEHTTEPKPEPKPQAEPAPKSVKVQTQPTTQKVDAEPKAPVIKTNTAKAKSEDDAVDAAIEAATPALKN